MSRIELAPELITEIGALYENKESIASICWSKNISPAIIIRALSEAGYKIRGKLRFIMQEKYLKMLFFEIL